MDSKRSNRDMISVDDLYRKSYELCYVNSVWWYGHVLKNDESIIQTMALHFLVRSI